MSGPSPLTTSFASNGNINSKTSVGNYDYGTTQPHAVIKVSNPENLISTADQRISYTSYNKVDSILQNNYIYTIKYGHRNQRTISKNFSNGTLQKTVYYVGAYEKEIVTGTYDKEINYIYGGDGLAAIYTIQYGSTNMYYVHKDHLGSLDKVTNSAGSVIQRTSFDAWGRRRNPDNWTYSNIPTTTFSRGYTGHEHLDQFDLINMNGRMYDPILGRFLSVDKYVQNPSFSQSFNRYSYCFNNPLMYIDPSGWQLAPIGIGRGMDKWVSDFSSGQRGGWFEALVDALGAGYNGSIKDFRDQYEIKMLDPDFAGPLTFEVNETLYLYYGTTKDGGRTFEHLVYRGSKEIITKIFIDPNTPIPFTTTKTLTSTEIPGKWFSVETFTKAVIKGDPKITMNYDKKGVLKSITMNSPVGNITMGSNSLVVGNGLLSVGLNNTNYVIGLTIPWLESTKAGAYLLVDKNTVNQILSYSWVGATLFIPELRVIPIFP